MRAKIIQEAEAREYRRVLLEPLDNIPGDADFLGHSRERLVALVNRTGLVEGEERGTILTRVKEDPMERVVDELAAAVIKDPETLEFLLEEVCVEARVRRVIDYLETFQAAGSA